ncbi:MAG TPA: MFS transporter [Burkholderiaceae bacterium]|nr:MFS transporter [Rhodoferax sp.]HQX57894.1 MFS transporter [Burkholderiaceae bacterium]HQZ05341.1 MFS transporter [Burkholderiaceae bacterium]
MQTDAPLSTRQGLAYGAMGLPLAFVALPLYVILPNHYATEFGMPLATLGLVLLGARLLDAVIDPAIGRWCDRLFARSPRQILVMAAFAAVVLAAGFGLLFFPSTRAPNLLLVWASVFLVITYAAYSALSVAHQSWGAMLGGDEVQRSRIVAWREGLALIGVVLASMAPVLLGLPGTWMLFCASLVAGWLAWSRALRPVARQALQQHSLWLPLQLPQFRRLLGIFVLNGIASAIPATLVLFFVQDRLQAPRSLEPVFLGTYFVCAAASMPLWLQLVRRIGLTRSWLCGMLVAVAAFVWAATLGTGDTLAFIVVCAASGVALGTDLALPGAMLSGLIARAGHRGHLEGAYFGWWNFATKLNLALAAGLALPLLAMFGYSPGARDASALGALTLAYCLLPCLLKLAAATLLYQHHQHMRASGEPA